PRATLFPYTTLFRSAQRIGPAKLIRRREADRVAPVARREEPLPSGAQPTARQRRVDAEAADRRIDVPGGKPQAVLRHRRQAGGCQKAKKSECPGPHAVRASALVRALL